MSAVEQLAPSMFTTMGTPAEPRLEPVSGKAPSRRVFSHTEAKVYYTNDEASMEQYKLDLEHVLAGTTSETVELLAKSRDLVMDSNNKPYFIIMMEWAVYEFKGGH